MVLHQLIHQYSWSYGWSQTLLESSARWLCFLVLRLTHVQNSTSFVYVAWMPETRS